MEKRERFYSLQKNFIFDKLQKDDDVNEFENVLPDIFYIERADGSEKIAIVNLGVTITFFPTTLKCDELDEILETISKEIE